METGMSCVHEELGGRDLSSMLCAGMTGYITGATLSSSMGRAVPVTLPSLQQAVTAAKRI